MQNKDTSKELFHSLGRDNMAFKAPKSSIRIPAC